MRTPSSSGENRASATPSTTLSGARELEEAQRRNDAGLAARLHDVLRTGYGLQAAGLETRCLIAVQVGDHLLGLAFRDKAGGDRTVLDETKRLLRLYLGV